MDIFRNFGGFFYNLFIIILIPITQATGIFIESSREYWESERVVDPRFVFIVEKQEKYYTEIIFTKSFSTRTDYAPTPFLPKNI